MRNWQVGRCFSFHKDCEKHKEQNKILLLQCCAEIKSALIGLIYYAFIYFFANLIFSSAFEAPKKA